RRSSGDPARAPGCCTLKAVGMKIAQPAALVPLKISFFVFSRFENTVSYGAYHQLGKACFILVGMRRSARGRAGQGGASGAATHLDRPAGRPLPPACRTRSKV